MHALHRALISAGAISCSLGAQTVPTRTLAHPDAEFTEGYSGIIGIRENRDGRVVVADGRDRTLQALDFRTGTATPIGRDGAGPFEWSWIFRVLAMPGDSTLIADRGNNRFLVVGPDAKPARTFSIDIAERTADGRQVRTVGGGPALASRGIDATGRLYFTGRGSVVTSAGIANLDSIPLIRFTIATGAQDTLAWLRQPRTSAPPPSRMSGGTQMVFGRMAIPFEVGDEWAVFPDGRVVIVRVADYRCDVVHPDGRRVRGTPAPFQPVPVTDAEKDAWRSIPPGGSSFSIGAGGQVNRSNTPSNTKRAEPPEWPAVKPPFVETDAAWPAPNGETWVVRTRSAVDSIPTADVFDSQGKLSARVVLPKNTHVAGFGAASVYLVRTDADGLQYLQRYRLP